MKLFNKITHLLLCTIISFFILNAGQPPMPGGMDLDGQPSEAEMQAFIENFMNNIDPETLDKLTRLGEEINKRAEQEGIDPFEMAERIGKEAQLANKDPFEYLNIDAKPTETVQPVTTPEQKSVDTKEPVEKKPIKPIDITRVGQMRFVLNSLADNLSLVRRKADANIDTREIITPFTHVIDDMISYLYTLNSEASLALLVEKEFDTLYQTLMAFENEISYLESRIAIMDPSVEGVISPYTILRVSRNASATVLDKAYTDALTKAGNNKEEKKAIVDAYETIRRHTDSLKYLEQFIDSVSQTAFTKKAFEDIKKLLTKTAPEYLKQKEEQDKLEAAARKDQEVAAQKRPPFSIPVYDQPASRSYEGKSSLGGGISGAPSAGSLGGSSSGSTPGFSDLGAQGKDSKAAPSSKGEKDKELKEEKDGVDKETKSVKKDDKKEKTTNPKVAKKLDEIEKQLKEVAYIFQDLSSSQEPTKLAASQAINGFDTYVAEPLLKKDEELTEDAVQERLKVMSIVQQTLKKVAQSFETIAKELTVTLGLNKTEKKELKEKAVKLYKEYAKAYLRQVKFLFNIDSITVDSKGSVVLSKTEDGSKTVTADPYKAYVLTGLGMDSSARDSLSIDNPNNASVKALNPSRDNFVKKVNDNLQEIRSTTRN